MESLQMTVGNRLPSFSAQLLDAYGLPITLTGYTAVLVVQAVDGGTAFGATSPLEQACTIVDAANGYVFYDWTQVQADAARAGLYNVSIRRTLITNPDESDEIAPASGATIIMRSATTGYGYLVTEDGRTVLTESGSPIPV